jgi:thioredoxin 1
MVPRREDSFEADMSSMQNMNIPQNINNVNMNVSNPSDQHYMNMYNQPTPNQEQPRESHVPHRVHDIESDRMFELLTNHNYHFTPNQKPMKIVCKVYTDWCKPCRDIAPFYEKLSADPEFSDILFVQLDGEKIEDNLAKIVKIGAVPVFIGFVGGKQVEFIPGPDREKVYSLCKQLSRI